jgi:glycosyltransferase involved in cell wall biosynthesis
VQKNFHPLTLSQMKISMVIPAFNEEKLIEKSLQAIQKASDAFRGLGWETEIIVCDNNSTDHTAELAREAGAKVVFEPINQIGRARNCGAAAAMGDWILFIDADSFPSAELLGEVGKVIASGKAIAGGSTVRLDSSNLTARFLTEAWNLTSRLLHWVAGSFIFCEANAFRAVGGFSNEFFTGEELDLSKRLKRFAGTQKKKIVIVSKFPLLTSDRKLHLYRRGELGRFFLNAFLCPKATMKNRDACSPWYDGRR